MTGRLKPLVDAGRVVEYDGRSGADFLQAVLARSSAGAGVVATSRHVRVRRVDKCGRRWTLVWNESLIEPAGVTLLKGDDGPAAELLLAPGQTISVYAGRVLMG